MRIFDLFFLLFRRRFVPFTTQVNDKEMNNTMYLIFYTIIATHTFYIYRCMSVYIYVVYLCF